MDNTSNKPGLSKVLNGAELLVSGLLAAVSCLEFFNSRNTQDLLLGIAFAAIFGIGIKNWSKPRQNQMVSFGLLALLLVIYLVKQL